MGVIQNILWATTGFFAIDHYFSDYIDNWWYKPGTAALSTPVVATAITGYIGMLTLLPRVMKNRVAINCNSLVIKHNEFLSAGSLYVFCNVCKIMLNVFLKGGFEALFCDQWMIQPSYNRLFFMYYIFHLSKFYEFLDTAFLILKKKDVIFLHWWHHITTLILTTATLNEYVPSAWYPIATNTLVHVVMYTYYALTAAGERVWWKRYITKLQISQFMTEIFFLFPISLWYRNVYFPRCHSSDFYIGLSATILGSFLLLFLKFYIKIYLGL